MQKNSASQSGLFTPRFLVALALCSCGVLLGMLSLAATPPAEVAGRNTAAPPTLFRPDQVATGFASEVNALPPGVPLPSGMASSLRDPRGALFSVNQQGDPLSSGPAAGFPSMPLAPAPAGGWAIVTSPNSRNLQNSYLFGVTCVSASNCWAVGSVFDSNAIPNYATLIERWDGTSWAVVASPNTTDAGGNAYPNFLTGVTCVSASDCWAVGFSKIGRASCRERV
jgi:hypothetical protein